jgi:superfamily II DNA or RNA helicase
MANDGRPGGSERGCPGPYSLEFIMAFTNVAIEIHVGNIESRLLGPAPIQSLDRALNPCLPLRLISEGQGAPAAGRGAAAARAPAPPAASAEEAGSASAEEGSAPPAEEAASGSAAAPALVFEPSSGTFLTGVLPKVKRLLRAAGIRFRIRDRRVTAAARHAWRLGGHPLRDYQREVVAEAVSRGRGLIDIGVGGGKSILAAAIVAELGLPCIWLVTTRALLAQTVRNLRAFLGVEPGVIGDGADRPGPLTVALVQSLWLREGDVPMWRGGTLVFDEGHHAAARTYQEVVRRIEPRYGFYLSAVPFRTGAEQAVLDALAGPPLTGQRYSARFLIEKGYCCPVEVRVERLAIRGEMAEKPFGSIYKEFIVLNQERNRKIAGIAREYMAAGRQVLVLVEQVRHGEEVLRLIGGASCFVHGKIPRRALLQKIARFADRGIPALVATSALLHEGIDIHGIEVVIAAGGLRSKARVIQSLGRGMRLAPGKRCCTYVDFLDADVAGILRAHARARLRVLKEEGFFIPQSDEEAENGEVEKAIPATWWHLPASKSFFLVDGDGKVLAKALCKSKALVPEKICKRCKHEKICQEGGKIVWHEELV